MSKLIIKLFFVFILFALITARAEAASVSVRLSQPKSPTNQDNFSLTFVSLDTQNRDIIVKCFKKGPADAGFAQFGSNINLTAGGNTGNCPVNSSVVNTSGSYQFHATAQAGADPEVQSPIVTVDFNNSSGPGTPTNYSKEKPTDCMYRIKFRTADDSGKTVRVELYRSENTSFNADSGTKVNSLAIGSNTDGQIENVIVDCSKIYYYVIRAFDNFGNGSGVVGDSVTTVTTKTLTTTVAALPTTGAIPITAEGLTTTGEVMGVATKEGEKGEIKGEATEGAKKEITPTTEVIGQIGPSAFFTLKKVVVIILTLAILGSLVTYFYRKKRAK